MNIIKPYVELWEPSLMSPLKHIERCARICYKSEPREDDYKNCLSFIAGLIKNKHLSAIEHFRFHFWISDKYYNFLMNHKSDFEYGLKHFTFSPAKDGGYIVTANLRALCDTEDVSVPLLDRIMLAYDIDEILRKAIPQKVDSNKFMAGSRLITCPLTEDMFEFPCDIDKHKTLTFHFVCDRGVSHEFVRHRVMSISQESTRYCNYAKNKFNNEITVIKPCFWNEEDEIYEIWKNSCLKSEEDYFALLKAGAKPEEARSVLPNSLKTELVMTGSIAEWYHFITLRIAPSAHPQARELAKIISDICYDIQINEI